MAAEIDSGKTAALPRSLLHLRFLQENGPPPDIVLFRDDAMAAPIERAYPGRGLSLGRETLPGKSPAGFLAARRANRAYYPAVAGKVRTTGATRLILFLEGEPLERFLLAQPQFTAFELWEDGLSHYVDLTGSLWYAARGAVQTLAGFHGKSAMRRRIDRSGLLVRDRFERRNLVLAPPPPAAAKRHELLLIGSPLVDDGIIRREAFVRGIQAVTAASPLPVRYLPHPRESLERLGQDLDRAGNIVLEPNPLGLSQHLLQYEYAAYVAAVSTGLLDIGRLDRSLFVPALFGLRGMHKVLSGWSLNPVPAIDDPAKLAAALREMASRETAPAA